MGGFPQFENADFFSKVARNPNFPLTSIFFLLRNFEFPFLVECAWRQIFFFIHSRAALVFKLTHLENFIPLLQQSSVIPALSAFFVGFSDSLFVDPTSKPPVKRCLPPTPPVAGTPPPLARRPPCLDPPPGVVLGHVGQNVALPSFADNLCLNCMTSTYFVALFTACASVLILSPPGFRSRSAPCPPYIVIFFCQKAVELIFLPPVLLCHAKDVLVPIKLLAYLIYPSSELQSMEQWNMLATQKRIFRC